MADVPSDETIEVIVRAGSTSNNEMEVNSDGSLNSQSHAAYHANEKRFYWCSYVFNLTNSGEKMAMYFRNPSGSGKVVRIIDITLVLENTVSAAAIVRLYANPTVSANGTAQTILPAYIGGSQPTAVSLITSAPTVSAHGSLYIAEQIGSANLGLSSTVEFDECLLLAENNSLLLTGDPDGTNRNMAITITWIEV